MPKWNDWMTSFSIMWLHKSHFRPFLNFSQWNDPHFWSEPLWSMWVWSKGLIELERSERAAFGSLSVKDISDIITPVLSKSMDSLMSEITQFSVGAVEILEWSLVWFIIGGLLEWPLVCSCEEEIILIGDRPCNRLDRCLCRPVCDGDCVVFYLCFSQAKLCWLNMTVYSLWLSLIHIWRCRRRG